MRKSALSVYFGVISFACVIAQTPLVDVEVVVLDERSYPVVMGAVSAIEGKSGQVQREIASRQAPYARLFSLPVGRYSLRYETLGHLVLSLEDIVVTSDGEKRFTIRPIWTDPVDGAPRINEYIVSGSEPPVHLLASKISRSKDKVSGSGAIVRVSWSGLSARGTNVQCNLKNGSCHLVGPVMVDCGNKEWKAEEAIVSGSSFKLLTKGLAFATATTSKSGLKCLEH